MPFASVAIHNALCRSNCKLLIPHLLPSSAGVMKVFQEPFTNCSRPSPWPGCHRPAQTDPSGARARSDIPANPGFDFSPGNSYEVEEEPGFHRKSEVAPPIKKYPKLSLITTLAYGG